MGEIVKCSSSTMIVIGTTATKDSLIFNAKFLFNRFPPYIIDVKALNQLIIISI